jgi:predicted MFS family arabinose efflux permease
VVKVIGERRLIPLAIFAIALGVGLIPYVWNVPTLLGALGILAMGMGFNNPSLTSMVSRLADPDDQGGILGLAASLSSLGRVVGPAWGGYLYDAHGTTTPYLSAATLMLIAFAISFVGLRSTRLPPPRGSLPTPGISA